jgi:A/G-specific adenine glycosylase
MAGASSRATPSRIRRVARRPRPVASDEELADARSLAPLLEAWFASNGREFVWREWTDDYRLTVAEVLLQRTRAETVARFVPSFIERFPDWPTLSSEPADSLEGILAPIGLSQRRADVLGRLAVFMAGRDEPVSEQAPGVGQYIGRAVAVMGRGARVAMVDSNWVRVLHRVFDGSWMADYRYDPRLQALSQAVVDGAGDPRVVNWAVLDLGATVCLPRTPRCGVCPLAGRCAYFTSTSSDGA